MLNVKILEKFNIEKISCNLLCPLKCDICTYGMNMLKKVNLSSLIVYKKKIVVRCSSFKDFYILNHNLNHEFKIKLKAKTLL